ncbi:MAG TPA: hypothetical protein VF897_10305, partial [Roseiflexaceae bacterium]
MMKRFLPFQGAARLPQLGGATPGASPDVAYERPTDRRAQLLWTLGNLCMLVGVVLLLYVGGLYTQAAYDRYAARGDTDLPAPVAAPQS